MALSFIALPVFVAFLKNLVWFCFRLEKELQTRKPTCKEFPISKLKLPCAVALYCWYIIYSESHISMSSSSRKGFKGTLHKWKDAMRRVTHEALNRMDERDQNEEGIDELFQGEERHSGESVTLGGASSEMRLTTETEDDVTEGTRVSNSKSQEEQESLTFEQCDYVDECSRLRREVGEPFYHGGLIWHRRREMWNQTTKSNIIQDSQRRRDKFAGIPKQYYIRIYKKLSIEGKPLKEPLNLQDALQVVNAGWTEIKKCENAYGF